jgi:hypothetical protein
MVQFLGVGREPVEELSMSMFIRSRVHDRMVDWHTFMSRDGSAH